MTDEEKAITAVKCYLDLDSAVAKALIVDICTLLRNERQELWASLKTAVDDLSQNG